MPPAGIFVVNECGMLAWSAKFENISVLPNPTNGARLLTIVKDNVEVYRRELSAAEARHIAGLLTRDSVV